MIYLFAATVKRKKNYQECELNKNIRNIDHRVSRKITGPCTDAAYLNRVPIFYYVYIGMIAFIV